MRRFEAVNGFEVSKLPKRATKFSAGYDFYAIEDTYIPSLFMVESENMAKQMIDEVENLWNTDRISYDAYITMIQKTSEDISKYADLYKPTLVRTGIKAKFPSDEMLILSNRSSNPKKGLFLANGIGVVDSDYYNNKENEGHIMFQFVNLGQDDVMIKAGDKIGQGIFMKYLITEDDSANGERSGGFGSTGN